MVPITNTTNGTEDSKVKVSTLRILRKIRHNKQLCDFDGGCRQVYGIPNVDYDRTCHQKSNMSGIFITRGMTVVIPKGGLTIAVDEKGKVNSSVTVHVHYDVCPTWLDLAARHLTDARERQLLRVAAWSSNDDKAKGETLEKEFESSMQAMMAAAIAIDSFYAALRDKTNIPEETIKSWRAKSTARYKQITEIIRRAFSLSPRYCVGLRNCLKEIFKFRDLAVHPSGNIRGGLCLCFR
jgi:hypothetical protein